ncbi:MAG: DUF58 domain-containing protein [Candidatus Eisenbacteria bacterium]|uniref:DUF58 domain-containing protein n=1 Tax=Eiseniibacteriota bacterium TaxID=2212470 RepID=A0A849SA88_UNCEI|nr:DUF58 domain-containing protein [Candidatus Eisenbacteria bacterium]
MSTAELLRKVRRLEIRSRHLVEDLFAGQSKSVFQGRGVEFEEVRPYLPGDEVRDIDWNVTARLGAPYVKRFVEERELTVMLAVDISRSMRFGTVGVEKRELAAELCAVLGFAALRNDDRVGLVLSDSRVTHLVPAVRGRRHLLRILRDVLEADSVAKETRLGEVARFLSRTLNRHSVVFWISDFDPAPESTALRSLGRRHDLTALALRDPRDEVLPAAGWLELEDLESGERALVNSSSARVREQYQRDARARWARAESALKEARCPMLEIRTDRSYLPVLMRYFATRRRGRRSA